MLTALLHQIRTFSGPAAIDVVRLAGPARVPGSDISALYVGNGVNLRFVQELLFTTSGATVIGHRPNALAVRAIIEQQLPSTDLVVTDLPPLWDRLAHLQRDIHVAAWLRQILDLPEFMEPNGRILPREIEREAARHVRRHDYAIELTTAEQDLRMFFRELYLPYTRARFAARAIDIDEPYFMARSAGHTLARLTAAGRTAAAMTFECKRGELHLGWYAAASNPPARGASEVLDVLCIRHAFANGMRRVVMGQSRPTLRDGVVRYKARFGTRIAAMKFPQQIIGIRINRWSAHIAACLNEPALLTIADGAPKIYRVASTPRQGVSLEDAASLSDV